MYKVAIVEDDPLFRKELAGIAASVEGIVVIGVFNQGEEFLSQIKRIQPDILFLDIGLPGISGIQVADFVRPNFPFVEIVFITADDDSLQDAFRLYAADYIAKPLDTERLYKTLTRIVNKFIVSDAKIELKCYESIKILNQRDIRFIEAQKKKTIVYTHNDTLVCLQSISDLEVQLDKKLFFRTGRSYLVNLKLVESIKISSRTTYQINFNGLKSCAYLPKQLYSEFRLRIKDLNKIEGEGVG